MSTSIIDGEGLGLVCDEKCDVKHFAFVLSGGAALSLWIRYLNSLQDDNTRHTALDQAITDDMYKTATTVMDWDIEVSETQLDTRVIASKCKLNKTKHDGMMGSYYSDHDVDKVFLTHLLAKMLPADCQITSDVGCGYIDSDTAPPYQRYQHGQIQYEENKLNKKKKFLARFHLLRDEKEEDLRYVFPMPPGVTKQDTFAKDHPAWTIGIVHPMVALGTHLDALSLASNPLDHDSFTDAELIAKNRRRAARVAVFRALMKTKFGGKPLEIENGPTFAYPDALKAAGHYFVESDFGKMLMEKGNDKEIVALGQKLKDVFKHFKNFTYFIL